MPRFGRTSSRSPLAVASLAVVALCLAAAPAVAQQLPGELQKSGRRFRAVFAPAAATARSSVVRVLRDGEPASLGVIVSADGYVLTKASQLGGPASVTLPDGRKVEATSITVDGDSDLALLKADASGLTPAVWADEEPAVGAWLVSVGDDELPAGVGVVSVAGRAIAAQRGVLGIVLADDPTLATVSRIFPDGGAAKAGLRIGDVITAIAGEPVGSRDALMRRLSRCRPGDTLPLVVRRDGHDEEMTATLGNEWSAFMDRQARQNLMGGSLSVRSGGFARAVQHDTVLSPEDCGGPIVDLSGRVVGLNIARAGRVETYALPAATVGPILRAMLAQVEGVSAR